jgi:predicted nuclease of predicted toxin-antitoxin system
MRFLIDNSVSWRLADLLSRLGHEAIHVRQVGLGDAADAEIYAHAVQERQIIVTQDVDFGTLLAMDKSKSTAVILYPTITGRQSDHM